MHLCSQVCQYQQGAKPAQHCMQSKDVYNHIKVGPTVKLRKAYGCSLQRQTLHHALDMFNQGLWASGGGCYVDATQ